MMEKTTTANAYDISLCDVSENKIREFSPLALAYIGDTVFDLYIRAYLVKNKMGKVMTLHKLASSVVNARSQATAAKLVLSHFSERENEIFRMGKNAKSTPPKNMSQLDYSLATGLEAVIGYLYCRGLTERIDTLFGIIIQHFFTEEPHA